MLYPIGIQDFEKIRKDGFVYVDKTDLVYKMAQKGGYYFLSRPRRFGKSLLVSTLEAYFSGKKELFDSLAIAELEKNWIQYPVLRFDLSGKQYKSISDLTEILFQHLVKFEVLYGVKPQFESPEARFKDVIDAAYAKTGIGVVILIDEYDKPIVDSLGDEKLNESFRSLLQGFYGVIKAKDACIKFGFLTGVTKIGKLSIFSGLNNLKDICEDSPGIYNPFSLLNTLDSKRFREYWFETGTPSFLVKMMKETSYDVTRLSGDEVGSSLLTNVDSAFANPVPFLYQAGYLTIKDYDKEYKLYKVGFPNKEVKDGFLNYLLNFYAPVQAESTNALISRMSRDIRSGNAEAALQQIEEKVYARRFADDKRKIFKIGVRFTTENRCIDSWKIAE